MLRGILHASSDGVFHAIGMGDRTCMACLPASNKSILLDAMIRIKIGDRPIGDSNWNASLLHLYIALVLASCLNVHVAGREGRNGGI